MTTTSALFDLDGTLTDPGDGFVKCVSHALAQLDCLRHSPAEILRHVGPPIEETLGKLLDGNRGRVQAAVALYRERYGSEGYLENAIYPEIEHTLAELGRRGLALFVATSKPTLYARRILEHFGLARHFSGIYGSEFDGARSNKGELIAHLLSDAGLEPASTVMIGDRAHDVVGALANAVRPIGALWGYGTRAELAGAGATQFCERPSQLPQALAQR